MSSELIYRPGLEGIIAGETAISSIAGGLNYRGYSIEDLAAHSTFEEVAYLLLYGELPTPQELSEFQERLSSEAKLPAEMIEILSKLPAESSMMDVMRTGASLLAHWDPDQNDNSKAANLRKAERLLAQLPIVLGVRHRQRQNLDVVMPEAGLSLAANTLRMLTGNTPSEAMARAMDVTLILYAEHEFNASTFTARVVCATQSDLHSSVTAAIGALKGPLHGGANERVMEVLEEVGSADRAEAWVREALANKVRIMGFGHRVYKTGDPRARYLKTLCQELATQSGHEELEQRAEVIESIVVSEKKLPPNLDWPSARIYYYMDLPIDVYTPLFVVSRVVGWSAHVIEQLENNRLIRPRANYTGHDLRPFVPLNERG